jgi:DNA-binding NarL/FixJ family response regulator
MGPEGWVFYCRDGSLPWIVDGRATGASGRGFSAHDHALVTTAEVSHDGSRSRDDMSGPPPLAVALVDDDRATRDGLASLIHGTPGYQCVATYGSVDEALRALSAVSPDVLLLDIHLPGLSGAEGVRLLRDKYPTIQVVMLTVFSEEERVFESLCNGACGYLLKKTPPARLLDAITEAHQGGSPMSPDIARKIVVHLQKNGPFEKPEQSLTPHELHPPDLREASRPYEISSCQQGAEEPADSLNGLYNMTRGVRLTLRA